MKKAIFLDRDGVVNKARVIFGKPHPPRSIEEVVIINGVSKAVIELQAKNFEIVVVTNQPDIARKETSQEKVEEINMHIRDKTGIDKFYICPHDDKDDCGCRKPKAGLILRAATDLNLDLNQSYLVGDRWKDIAAGQLAGCECYYIDESYTEVKPKLPYTKVKSLEEASWIILNKLKYSPRPICK